MIRSFDLFQEQQPENKILGDDEEISIVFFFFIYSLYPYFFFFFSLLIYALLGFCQREQVSSLPPAHFLKKATVSSILSQSKTTTRGDEDQRG